MYDQGGWSTPQNPYGGGWGQPPQNPYGPSAAPPPYGPGPGQPYPPGPAPYGAAPPPYGMGPYGVGPPPNQTPGVVTGARVLMFIQGGLSGIATLILLFIGLVLGILSASSDDDLTQTVSGVAAVILIIIGVIYLAITVVMFILAGRFSAGRRGVWVGTIVVESIFSALAVGSFVWTAAVQNSLGSGIVWGGGFGTMSIVVLVLVLTEPARQYFQQPRY